MIVHSDSADHGERSHQAAIPQYVCLPEPGSFAELAKMVKPFISSVSLMRSLSSTAMATGWRAVESARRSGRRPPALLAQAIKGAIEAADLPAAKGQLGKPGDGGDDD